MDYDRIHRLGAENLAGLDSPFGLRSSPLSYVRLISAPMAENKTIDVTVYVGEGGAPFHCTVLGVQSAREQTNVVLKALREFELKGAALPHKGNYGSRRRRLRSAFVEWELNQLLGKVAARSSLPIGRAREVRPMRLLTANNRISAQRKIDCAAI
jgi:hypothetical protein